MNLRTKRRKAVKYAFCLATLATLALIFLAPTSMLSQAVVAPPSLTTIPSPKPPNLSAFVPGGVGSNSEAALIKLGKALFWDMQVGGDGRTACATCHFHAGADHRKINQLNPFNGVFDVKPANGTLAANDFPLTRPGSDKDDRVGSQGVHNRIFDDIVPGNPVDACHTPGALPIDPLPPDPAFVVNGLSVRRVTGRNTPTAVTSNFNLRNFWDARAYHRFNGR